MSKISIESIRVELNKKSSARIYQYSDDNASVYFENIRVDSEFQRKGLGTRLLRMLEVFGKSLGATESYLWVRKDSWMHEWYRRKGYTDFKEHQVTNFIWMKKHLITN